MLSWALKRNSDSNRDAPGPDDTQIEGPDTPAPVFAVRALKTALFGTPAPRIYDQPKQTRAIATGKTSTAVEKSPIKPPGILLTPGTGAARRKRVSFGHGVKEGSVVESTSTSGLPDECPGKFPSPWVGGSEGRPKTRLTETMENSRANKTKQPDSTAKNSEVEDAWEDDEWSDRDTDVTVDLNEPHSCSGKYWKSYFESYHADAKAEMEKLVKYKSLAKSYAKKKDAEAVDLHEKLKEEQQRVKLMESKVSELSRQVVLTKKRGASESDTGLMMDELAKQTALALEYRKQVEELESLMMAGAEDADVDEKGQRQRRIASPRTQKTLIETQRELRKARSQARELEKIREERDRLRQELKFAEQRANKLVEENKKISTDLSQSTSKIYELEKKLVESRGETLLKDRELKKARTDYQQLKEDAKARMVEAHQVVGKKDEAIAGLKDEIGSLKADRVESTEPKRTASPSTKTKPRARSSTEGTKRNSYEDAALVSSRALREKIESDMGKRMPAVLSDRANLQESRSSASSGVSQVSAYTKPTSSLATGRAERASWTATSTRNSATKGLHDDILGDTYTTKASYKPREHQQPPRRTTRPPSPGIEAPRVDLVEANFARLGGPEHTQNSTMWTMDASRTSTMTADRRAAAQARLAQKRAQRERERQQQQPDRNKENLPMMGAN